MGGPAPCTAAQRAGWIEAARRQRKGERSLRREPQQPASWRRKTMEVLEATRGLDPKDPLRAKIDLALLRTRRALALYARPGEEKSELALSFNGGKDSTVVLHLLRAAAADMDYCSTSGGTEKGSKMPFLTFFFPHPDDFKEITAFVEDCGREYKLDVHAFPSDGSVGFKQGLQHLVQDRGVRAMVIGTRAGDPNAKGQDPFCPSSEGWPAFMRVNPILDWTYAEVWSFLRLAKCKYCSLYDEGYTSLGSTKDTKKNEALLDGKTGTYRPAHALLDQEAERAGRA